ncbi:TadE family protein [Agromyces intestinalis]|uniref:TadE family protein n=1 Tax=Agromyces intestinalis TaxID=2592652 RepID=A0A5C1YM10_9MICO|nr:TadE family protein [Agromyces intestinalis]
MHADTGSASLEFLTVGLLMLVPLVYLVLAVSAIQAGSLGVEGAARHAARVAVLTADDPRAAVERAVHVSLDDYGITAGEASVTLDCDPGCREPGARVRVDVVARVALPLVPELPGLEQVGSVTVQGTATQTVSRFAGAGS